MYVTRKFAPEFLREDILYASDVTKCIVSDTITGNSRWTINHELVFKYEGKYYRTHYSVGATEYQDERPWQYEDDVECEEVEPIEVIRIQFLPILRKSFEMTENEQRLLKLCQDLEDERDKLKKKVSELLDNEKSWKAADDHRKYWEVKADERLVLLRKIADFYCTRKKLGAPCYKALEKEHWCPPCFAKDYTDNMEPE